MQKKKVLIIILILTVSLLGISLLTSTKRYNSLKITEKKWNKILSERVENDTISIKNVTFNDYPLFISNNNNRIYYSFVDTTNKFNPTVKYIGNQNEIKLVVKQSLSNTTVDQDKKIEMMIYNKDYYRIYTLYITKRPMINIMYNEINNKTTKGEILVIDNQKNANQKIIRTSASITMDENHDFIISMRKKSVGRNTRKNEISILGISMNHEFQLIKSIYEKDEKSPLLDVFINNEYQGIYRLDYKEQRGY